MNRLLVCTVSAIAALSVAGCSGNSDAQQQPKPTAAPAASAPPKDVLKTMDPCAVVTKALNGESGWSKPKNELPGFHACMSKKGTDQFGVTFNSDAGLDSTSQTTGGTVESTTIGGHKANKSDGNSICQVSIEVTPTSRADVQMTSNDNTGVCDKEMPYAEKVAAQLPKS